MSEPTERSIPAVRSTKVMPVARIPSDADCTTMLTRFGISRKRGEKRENAPITRPRSHRAGHCRRQALHAGVSSDSAEGGGEDALAVERLPLELVGDRATPHHEDAVGEAQELLDLRGHEEDRGAGVGQLPHQLVDLLLGPHVDPPGGLVEEHHRRRGQEPLAEDDLLLVASGKRPRRAVQPRRRLQPDRVRPACASAVGQAATVDQAPPGVGGEGHEGKIVGGRGVEEETVVAAVLGDEGQPAPHRVPGRAAAEGRPEEPDLPGVGPVEAEHRAQHLGAAGPHEPGETENLSAVQGEAHVAESPVPSEAGDLEGRLAKEPGRRERGRPRRGSGPPCDG